MIQAAGAAAVSAKLSPLAYPGFDIGALSARLDAEGWAVVAGVPCDAGNASLLALARSLGPIKAGDAGDPTHEGDAVHAVASYARPVLDSSGKTMLSTTATVFDLHTDESYKRAPCRYVLLHCWRADAQGGVSLLATSESILTRLEPWAAALCFRARFVWRECAAPILAPESGRAWPRVRFNLREIAGDEIGDGEPDLRARTVPDVFAAAADAAAVRLTLASGDCLVLDNRRVLHGRTGFDLGSERLLKRVWVTSPGEA